MQYFKRPIGHHSIAEIIRIGCILFFLASLTVVAGQEGDTCEAHLNSAEEKYFTGYFEAAIEQIQNCLQQEKLDGDLKIRACKLLCLSQLANNDPEAARASVEDLLTMVPGYAPDAENDPRQFVELVNTIKLETGREEMQSESRIIPIKLPGDVTSKEGSDSSGISKWILIGGATGGIVAALVTLAMNGNPDAEGGNDGNDGGNGNNGRNGPR